MDQRRQRLEPRILNARLFGVWISGCSNSAPVAWTPAHVWVWTAPPDAPPWKSINLRDYCQPQSFMVRFRRVPKNGVVLRIFMTYVCSLMLGVLLLGLVIVRAVKEAWTERAGELTLNPNEVHVSCATNRFQKGP